MNKLLAITAECRDNKQCFFDDQEMFLDILITNTSENQIGFPLEYVKIAGPSVKLTDTYTMVEAYLKPGLADFDLRKDFIVIQPGQSVSIEWVIMGDELKQFNQTRVNVSAEITVSVDIVVNKRSVKFLGADTLHIVSKPN